MTNELPKQNRSLSHDFSSCDDPSQSVSCWFVLTQVRERLCVASPHTHTVQDPHVPQTPVSTELKVFDPIFVLILIFLGSF